MLQVEALLGEVDGQRVEQFGVAGRVGGPHVVDRLDQSAAQQIGHVAVDHVAGEKRIVGAGQPVGKRLPPVGRFGRRLAFERRRLHHLAGARVAHFAAGADQHDLLVAEQAEFLAPLDAHAGKEGGEAVVVVLAVFLERVMVALGAGQPHAQEQLAGRLGPVLRVVGDAVEIGRAVAVTPNPWP